MEPETQFMRMVVRGSLKGFHTILVFCSGNPACQARGHLATGWNFAARGCSEVYGALLHIRIGAQACLKVFSPGSI